jgi:hypothetical protein
MFHFPAFPPHTLYIQMRVTAGNKPDCRVTPFGHPRITARLATPRGLSQPPTSFIGSWCQGIHHALLVAWPQRCSRPLCSSQTTNNPHHQPTPVNEDHTTNTRSQRPRFVERKACPEETTKATHPDTTPTTGTTSWQMARGPFPQDPTGCTRTPPTNPWSRSTPPPAEAGNRGSTRVRELVPRGSQARFHILEPHPPTPSAEKDADLNPPPPTHSVARVS